MATRWAAAGDGTVQLRRAPGSGDTIPDAVRDDRQRSAAADDASVDAVRLGSALRALRRKRGWTQAEVARRARVSQTAVSRAERGEALSLTGRTLKAIAE